MLPVLEKAYRGVTKKLPPAVAGRVDLLRPSFAAAWGGPLNGQEHRRAIVRALARAVDVDLVLETGTYRGTSTEFFAAVFGKPVQTVEGSLRNFTFARHRLAAQPQITVHLGDSRTFLKGLSGTSEQTVFVYLDAHWEDDLPLREELEIIRSTWPKAIVMVDDFQVPGDPGYTYDDYGPGKALVESYLPPLEGWVLLYPSLPSAQETGARRGCCVLVSPALVDAVQVPELKAARTL
jgi:predicted O-methyltransferase YrrM